MMATTLGSSPDISELYRTRADMELLTDIEDRLEERIVLETLNALLNDEDSWLSIEATTSDSDSSLTCPNGEPKHARQPPPTRHNPSISSSKRRRLEIERLRFESEQLQSKLAFLQLQHRINELTSTSIGEEKASIKRLTCDVLAHEWRAIAGRQLKLRRQSEEERVRLLSEVEKRYKAVLLMENMLRHMGQTVRNCGLLKLHFNECFPVQ